MPEDANGTQDDLVEVLLSTYNGERYLPELLASVWAQSGVDLALSVRDDGSTDGTIKLLECQLRGHPARLRVGEHLGAAQSFMTLLREVSPTCSYAAFCDQDDVWLPGKVAAAISALKGLDNNQSPTLYCSAVNLTSEDLTHIRVHRRCTRRASFENALVENIATGCTIVLNRAAIDLLASRHPQRLLMHDAWCYLVVAGCGKVVYDPVPRVLYRLHSSNTVGVGTTLKSEWSRRVRRQLSEGRQRVLTRQAEELGQLYGDRLCPEASRSLQDFLVSQSSLSERLHYTFRGAAYRQRRVDDLIYRLLYMFGRI